MYEKRGIIVLCPFIIAFILRKRKKLEAPMNSFRFTKMHGRKQLYLCESI